MPIPNSDLEIVRIMGAPRDSRTSIVIPRFLHDQAIEFAREFDLNFNSVVIYGLKLAVDSKSKGRK